MAQLDGASGFDIDLYTKRKRLIWKKRQVWGVPACRELTALWHSPNTGTLGMPWMMMAHGSSHPMCQLPLSHYLTKGGWTLMMPLGTCSKHSHPSVSIRGLIPGPLQILKSTNAPSSLYKLHGTYTTLPCM
jgi:hypothetical protein